MSRRELLNLFPRQTTLDSILEIYTKKFGLLNSTLNVLWLDTSLGMVSSHEYYWTCQCVHYSA